MSAILDITGKPLQPKNRTRIRWYAQDFSKIAATLVLVAAGCFAFLPL